MPALRVFLRHVLPCAFVLAAPLCAQPQEQVQEQPPVPVTIGVQLVQDEAAEIARWQHWVQQWAWRVPHLQVRLAPMHWDALQQAVAEGRLHFTVSNPGHFVALQARHGVVRLATEISDLGPADVAHAVGSAVIVPAGSALHGQLQLRGQTVAAVDPQAFGGYQVMAAQWKKQGLDARTDVQMRFTGYPMERALQAVQQGQAQAAIVRVCMLEQLVARGVLRARDWRVLPPLHGSVPADMRCQASSPLYPGWALAMLPATPQPLAHDVLVAVLTQQDAAAGRRWTVPADYQPVHEVLRTLQVPPYAPQALNMRQWLWQHRYWGLLPLALLLGGVSYVLHVRALVRRRTQALQRSLQERDQLAQQMALTREKMNHMSCLSVLGELSAMLAHEISHPLASLSNYVQGLRRRQAQGQLQPAQLGSALQAMDDALGRCQGVLQSVRALARKRVSVQTQGPLWPVVCEAVELFRSMAARGLQIRLHCPPQLQQAEVVMDALQIQQVLLNLLKNALDLHQQEQRMHLPVTVCLGQGPEPQTLALAVCDQGPPLSESQLQRLFEPFYSTKPEGMGLGLSICRSIAELHGGQLRARACQSGEGLCMELLLPLARSAADRCVAAGAGSAAGAPSRADTVSPFTPRQHKENDA